MNLRRITAGATLALLTVASGQAQACTQDDVTTKAAHLSHLVQVKAAQDPVQGQALTAKMQPIMDSLQAQTTSGGTVDWNSVCSQYDALIAQVSIGAM
jgi:hypothetical protein